MDLTVGCKEQVGAHWIYHLRNGTVLSQEEWINYVKDHIATYDNKCVFEHIRSTVKLWSKQDTLEEIALQVYASKYCTNLQLAPQQMKHQLQVVIDEMGCKQLSFY